MQVCLLVHIVSLRRWVYKRNHRQQFCHGRK